MFVFCRVGQRVLTTRVLDSLRRVEKATAIQISDLESETKDASDIKISLKTELKKNKLSFEREKNVKTELIFFELIFQEPSLFSKKAILLSKKARKTDLISQKSIKIEKKIRSVF